LFLITFCLDSAEIRRALDWSGDGVCQGEDKLRVRGREEIADLEAQEEPVEQRLEILALWELVGGSEQGNERTSDGCPSL